MIRQRAAANHKPLHNFTLPRLRWGKQIPMPCAKTAADHSMLASSSSSTSAIPVLNRRSVQRSVHRTSFAPMLVAAEGIEAVREKLMMDLKTETDKIRRELLKDEEKENEDDDVVEAVAVAAAAAGEFGGGSANVAAPAAQSKKDGVAESRPWNLRTRRAPAKGSPARKEGGIMTKGKEEESPEKEKEREKFALGLKRKEIEEDFMILTGHRPPRRPKKRPLAVRKQLDVLFPGKWLTEISAEAYMVVEAPDGSPAKRPAAARSVGFSQVHDR